MQTKGNRTTFGSLIYRHFVPNVDDLKVLEIVDAGVWNVGMTIPLSMFSDDV